MKKVLSILLALLLITVAASGCLGGDSKSDDESADSGESDETSLNERGGKPAYIVPRPGPSLLVWIDQGFAWKVKVEYFHAIPPDTVPEE